MCLGAGLIWTKRAAKEAEANKRGVPKNRVKISACTEPSRGCEGTTDVIIYPEVFSAPSPVFSFFFLLFFFKCTILYHGYVPGVTGLLLRGSIVNRTKYC